MKNYIILIAGICFLLVACQKEEEPVFIGNDPDLPVIIPHGCFVQNIIAWNLNPLYTYDYNEAYPSVLEGFKVYDEISGDVLYSYVIKYDESSTTLELDSLIHYYGDVDYGAGYANITTFHYTWIGGVPIMDSARIFVNDLFGGTIIKGTIQYGYNGNLLDTLFYYDYPHNDAGTFYDDYFFTYKYDANDQMIEMHYHNYNGIEIYSEIHELTNFIMPNYTFITNPELYKATVYAPSKTTAWYSGTGTYEYNFIYQINEKNYVSEQDLIESDGDTVFLKLFTYECFD